MRERLEEIETALAAAATGSMPFVTEAARHIISAGGKRFRPLLVILASSLGTPRSAEDLTRAALVMELTHVASLYHDDVMDEAEIRRGAPSANSVWDNSVAILIGDYLFARASDIVADLGVDFVRLQARTFSRLVQGQIAETVGPAEGQDAVGAYLDVVADKTGSLIASSAMFGGMVAGLPDEQVAALAGFGEELGVVFQLSDDLIDITSDSTGKTPGTDLREGVPTLPTLMLADYHDEDSCDLLAQIHGDLSDDAALAEVLRRLRGHAVIERAGDEVARRAEVARGHLALLPEGIARDALSELCDTVVSRSA
ncbi:MAG: polyprenyl synthetase family protein [Raineyella sp.]|nr:polyprenyl synthetase family protein [Raineyella sp.]MEA5155720.1 polyprenyl synthetase family protein [Raineyella sp.]